MKFRVLQGNYITGERGNRITYKTGDIVETDKDLLKVKNKFELVEEVKAPKTNSIEVTEINGISERDIDDEKQAEIISTQKKIKRRSDRTYSNFCNRLSEVGTFHDFCNSLSSRSLDRREQGSKDK